jgi:hypothetical protein
MMLRGFKISYVYVNSHVDFNLNKKIIKLKMITLLHSLDGYMVIIIKMF